MISGCVRTLAITTQKGDPEPSWEENCAASVKLKVGEGRVRQGAGSKTENIIILLYKSMVHMCLECCVQSLVPQRGCSGMRKSAAVLAGILLSDGGLCLAGRGGSSPRVKYGRAVGQEWQAWRQKV